MAQLLHDFHGVHLASDGCECTAYETVTHPQATRRLSSFQKPVTLRGAFKMNTEYTIACKFFTDPTTCLQARLATRAGNVGHMKEPKSRPWASSLWPCKKCIRLPLHGLHAMTHKRS